MDMDMIEDRASARFPNSVTHRFGFVEGWKACVGLYFGDGPVAPKPAEDGEPTPAQIMDKLQDVTELIRASYENLQAEIGWARNVAVDVGQKVEAVLDQVTEAGDAEEAELDREIAELMKGLAGRVFAGPEDPRSRAARYDQARKVLEDQMEADERHMAKVLESREPFAREGSVGEERDHLRDTVRPMMKSFVPTSFKIDPKSFRPGYMADTRAPDGKARTILGVDAAAPGSDQTVYVILNHPVSRELYEAFMQFEEGQRGRIQKLEDALAAKPEPIGGQSFMKACHEMLAKSFDDGFRFGEQFEKIRQRGRAE